MKLKIYCCEIDCQKSIEAEEDDNRLTSMGYYVCDEHKKISSA